MPKNFVRGRRSTATLTSVTLVLASTAVLMVNPATTPLAAAAAPGSTQRASVTGPDNQSRQGGFASMLSGNGESVAFVSREQLDNLGTGGFENVYVRDLVKRRTVMISRGQFTRPDPSSSQQPPVIRLGQEKALNLQAPLANRAQQLPIVDTPPNGGSSDPTISADGRFVAFATNARNMFIEDNDSDSEIVVVDRDPNGDGNYDEDLNGQRVYKYYRITRDDRRLFPGLPKIAANASRVAWLQFPEGSEVATAALDLKTGAVGQAEVVPDTLGGNNPFSVSDPAISGDGNHIAMRASFFVGEFGGHEAILSTDMVKREVTRVDFNGGKPVSNDFDENVARPAINFDGTVIAFVGEPDSEGSAPNEPNIYAVTVNYGLAADKRVTASRIASIDNVGNLINADRPGLSADGRYIAFTTDAFRAHDGTDGVGQDISCINIPNDDLTRGPALRLNAALPPPREQPRTTCQVVVRDLIIDAQRELAKERPVSGALISTTGGGAGGNDDSIPDRDFSTAPSLSANGGRVGFDSSASNLVGNDGNQRVDVFVRTLEPSLRGDAVSFGPVKLGESLTKTARVNHVGAGPLDVDQITISGPNAGEFSLGAQTCQSAAAAAAIHQTGGCDISVTFTPTALGDRRGQLRIRLRGGRDMPPIDLTGVGSKDPTPATFEAGPDPVNFGARLLLSNGPESAVTVTNKGETPLTISSVNIIGPGAPGDYSIASNTCTTVATDATCRVAVKFSPKLAGTRDAILQFNHSAPGGPRLIALKGSGNQPTLEVNPGVSPPGRVITVIGKQFPPGKTVTVKFDGRVGQAAVVAGADGSFRVPLLVYPKATPETRSVLGTVDGFAEPLAKAPLLIVFATVSPAEFVIRN